jgi:ABC-type branched-subunit amino acid transport system ATPase component
MSEIILDMKNITKVFPGVKALDNVNLKVKRGEIHALVGENGAGKSTLMNVLSGIYPFGTYSGDVFFEGKKCEFKSVRDSEKAGIAIIHQELALNPYMTIAENIFLCNERSKYGIINWDRTNQEAKKLISKVGLKEKHSTLVMDIGVGKQQLVEIAKALSKDVRLLILDEPTAALNDRDSDNLLNLLLELNQQGLTCIIISHKIHEVTRIADQITIIRDGMIVETLVNGVDEFSENRIIKGMVGRELVNRFPPREKVNIGEIGFEVKDWVVYDPLDDDRMRIKNVSFNVRKGEVVGIAGLMGAGRTELVMSLFGRAYGKKISGTILKDGKKLLLKTVSEAISEEYDLFEYYGIESAIREALSRKVWLKCGGYLVFDETESLTVIDVNTGKFTGKNEQENTILKTNLEAAAAIGRQIRLRNIEGIILVDFIDMKENSHKEKVMSLLKEVVSLDRSKVVIEGMTSLGLVEMTRKKVHGSLRKAITEPCPVCGGTGRLIQQPR